MKVLLICYAGMSTSLLVSKLQKTVESKGLDYEFEAIGTLDFDDYYEENQVDFILMGPQARHMYTEINEKIEDTQIPMKVIDSKIYGRMDADAILEMLK